MEDYLSQLNSQQREAVEYLHGPQLVIAGAGSGKTRVLTYKIVHLLAHGYEPYRIMALTFTNKAANEMRERIQKLVGAGIANKLWMGTFHSIFARLLRNHADRIGFKPSFTIYDAADSKALIKTIIKDMQLDDKIYKASTVQGAISMAKNALISPERYAADKDIMEADRRARRPLMHEIYRIYRHRCFVAGAMDFDDLLYYTNILLRDNPDVCRHYREFFRYVLVDEYQDTNFAQHCIVSELCRDSNSLTMVGDDAQSIYSFRGANIKNILNLKKAYPDLRIFKLEQNYRSTQNIVDAANSLIEKNREQIRKQVFSRNDIGDRIEVINCSTDFEEAFLVANRIAQLRRTTHDSLDEFAVLYRTNAQSRRLEESLRKRNISYRIYGGLSFYQRKEVKDAIAYFRLATNPDDDEALRRVINYPARGIGETTVAKLTRAAIEHRVSIWKVLNDPAAYDLPVNSATLKKLEAFRQLIADFNMANDNGAEAYKLATTIIGSTRLLSSLINDSTPESISKQENLQEILSNVKDFVDEKTEAGELDNTRMQDFLAEVSLATDQDEQDTSEQRVTLMTVHAAKGLEFNNVIVVGVEEELFPSAMASGTISEIEEERRLLYVAVTRARKFCMLSYSSSRFRNGQTKICQPSRFLHDIDSRYLKPVQGTDLGEPSGTNPYERYRSSFHSPVATHSVINPPSGKPLRHSNASGRWQPASVPTATHSSPATGGEFSLHTIEEVAPGMEIMHERFGRGKITDIDPEPTGAKIVVLFSNVEQRKLMLKYAKFKIL
ncbi:MAG: UvrD-helicase domain-containing protein [Muribaculaceae bacterium]|nr:UvrD-helicase domain-containing protein [Muribaculaceae bacterium]